jgi:methionine-S-sulfoxide reductase
MSTQKALFAAGCFWGIQYYFDEVPGVVKTTVGYTGGHTKNPTYDEVCTHLTGHAESTLIEFDPKQVSYEVLLKHFFRIHNPTLLDSDGINVGDEYRSAIFYFDDAQEKAAEKAITVIQKEYKNPIVTKLTKADEFYEAEGYHQKFTERTGIGMCYVPYTPLA